MTSLRRRDVFPTEVTAENFVSIEFEEKFGLYAAQFGFAGKEFNLRKKLEDKDFGFPNPRITVKWHEDVEEEVPDPTDASKRITITRTVERYGRYSEVNPERYKGELAQALKNKAQYKSDLQTLCSELLLCLDKNLRQSVTQHEKYKEAHGTDDILELFNIVKECAIGRGAFSVYTHLIRFLTIRQKSNTAADFAEYTKNYEDVVTDIMNLGTPADVLKNLFNAKFIEGLNKEMFRDQLSEVMGSEKWPDRKEFAAKLRRFVIATTGIREAMGGSAEGVVVAAKQGRNAPWCAIIAERET